LVGRSELRVVPWDLESVPWMAGTLVQLLGIKLGLLAGTLALPLVVPWGLTLERLLAGRSELRLVPWDLESVTSLAGTLVQLLGIMLGLLAGTLVLPLVVLWGLTLERSLVGRSELRLVPWDLESVPWLAGTLVQLLGIKLGLLAGTLVLPLVVPWGLTLERSLAGQ
jgi:hypothetical protein